MATFLATYDFLLVSMVLAAVLALTLYLPLMAGQLSVASPGFYALGGYVAATPEDSMPELGQATQDTLQALLAAREPLDDLGSSKRAELLLAPTELLLKVARDQPVFVVLDDLDLADDDTLVLLRQIYRRRHGTSLLIAVSVTMDTVAQVQSHLLAHQYEGLIKKAKLRGATRRT